MIIRNRKWLRLKGLNRSIGIGWLGELWECGAKGWRPVGLRRDYMNTYKTTINPKP